jgi:hypothetical protein
MMTFLKYLFYLLLLIIVVYIGMVFYDVNWGNEQTNTETIVVTEN